MKNSAQECNMAFSGSPQVEVSASDVFDLSAMLVKASDDSRLHLHLGREDPACCSPTKTPPPPLETLTSCTDDDSVSSVSTQGSSSVQRRSVFSQFWKTAGQEPSISRVSRVDQRACISATPPLSLPQNPLQFLPTQPEDEVVLDAKIPLRSPTDSLRRSILPNTSRSYSVPYQLSNFPSLCNTTAIDSAARSQFPRKSHSSPQLGQKQPGASCLRESRFSSVKAKVSSPTAAPPTISSTLASSPNLYDNDLSSVSSSSVRFDMNAVAVRHFERPQENYAEEGWTEYFH